MTRSLARGFRVVGGLLVLSCGGTVSLREGSGGSTSTGDSSFVKCESDADCAGVTGAHSCQAGLCRAPELAQAGAPAQGGAGSLAGTGGSAPASGGRKGTGGMTTGSGGISAGTSGAGSGGTGPGGMQGTGGAGTGGAGTGGAYLLALDGLRLDAPCGTKLDGNYCVYPGKVDDGMPFSAMVAATMGGTPGTAYEVTLHIRGVTAMTHVNGGVVGSPENFVTGGTRFPDHTNETTYELWTITTSSPSQHYYLNINPSGLSRVCVLIDMVQTIMIDGGAMVTLDVYDGNSHQVSNTIAPPLAPPGVPGSMNSGQFIQINVDGVTM